MYKVVETFADLKDHKHIYHVGDKFPRDGVSVESDRLEELSGNKNLMKKPLIEWVEERETDADADLPVPEKLVQPKAKRRRVSKVGR